MKKEVKKSNDMNIRILTKTGNYTLTTTATATQLHIPLQRYSSLNNILK
jgi:hypothetical protein